MNSTGTRFYEGVKMTHDASQKVRDELTLEHPLAIHIAGEEFTLTMHTPADEADLVRGLLYTEGVVRKKQGHIDMEVVERDTHGFISVVNVIGEEVDMQSVQLNKRSLLSVASCGICGKTELVVPIGRLAPSASPLDEAAATSMFGAMKEKQGAYLSGGGSHAAAIFNTDYEMLVLREDIGRHNAVDKAIGALLNSNSLGKGLFLLVSGRVSYEIVVKCFVAGVPNLLAVSAPSSLAVDFCKELGITLYGFCREGRITRYS